ncbi:MAG TPA: cupin domain-containing protein [Burkholderiales bacterium]|nr:cupin domain-containing protein [Burkholderiales bacterium]
MSQSHYSHIQPFVTLDGSQIRELMHPAHHANRNQSLAEAIVRPGQETLLHKHVRTEELYHITSGTGWMTLAEEQFAVVPGDTICIPPGTAHCIRNTGTDPLRILCCCSPPYSDEDTVLLTGYGGSAIA